jgi:hypothetical protein
VSSDGKLLLIALGTCLVASLAVIASAFRRVPIENRIPPARIVTDASSPITSPKRTRVDRTRLWIGILLTIVAVLALAFAVASLAKASGGAVSEGNVGKL